MSLHFLYSEFRENIYSLVLCSMLSGVVLGILFCLIVYGGFVGLVVLSGAFFFVCFVVVLVLLTHCIERAKDIFGE